nr:MAG TPA: hypothetical protein [Caudoviricetes sp.]
MLRAKKVKVVLCSLVVSYSCFLKTVANIDTSA